MMNIFQRPYGKHFRAAGVVLGQRVRMMVVRLEVSGPALVMRGKRVESRHSQQAKHPKHLNILKGEYFKFVYHVL